MKKTVNEQTPNNVVTSQIPEYDHLALEKKWQAEWQKSGIYKTSEGGDKPKAYILDMFPYPSGSGLHVGHPKGYIASDVLARFKRMNGFNVLHPMGWDAFGLPAEEFAIKNKIHPSIAVKENVKRYKEQLSILGFCYDWDREVNTTDPEYYKWTQWAFLQMFKKGLVHESNEPINWCPSCKTGLANEDLENGKCERCGSVVEKKPIRQWVIEITKYADRLLKDLESLDWPNSIKESQKNWIGRSVGQEIVFKIKTDASSAEMSEQEPVSVFTTRPETIMGVTYLVLAPEHHLVQRLQPQIKNWDEVSSFISDVKKKTQIERTAEGKEKTGVALSGIKVINPANNEEVPVWIADYVLLDYGTGAVMAVPAHDERDHAFSTKYNLPIVDKEFIEFKGGKEVVKYKLRDWVFSRQRYWGEPIPLIHCEKCGVVPVPEAELPLKLPDVEFYEPTGTGESPLAAISEWVNVSCPQCSGSAKRETNTMPQWAGSCWYYLRYMDPKNENQLVSPEKEKYWSPVDVYVGGTEHATRHLIYARFWHKFLYDIGVVSTNEPFSQLRNQGLIAGPDGQKMSKRFGNVVNPDDIVKLYGADTLRVYEMFMGPFESGIAWSTDNMMGSRRFVEKIWRLRAKVSIEGGNGETPINLRPETEQLIHKTIKKVGEDISNFSHNTAISSLMILLNQFESEAAIDVKSYEILLKLVAPFTPHLSEELWSQIGHKNSIHLESWPAFDEAKLVVNSYKIAVQVNGKVRAVFETEDTDDEAVIKACMELPEVKKHTEGKEIIKKVYVKNRIVNLVVKG